MCEASMMSGVLLGSPIKDGNGRIILIQHDAVCIIFCSVSAQTLLLCSPLPSKYIAKMM
jgi:hypothetical protein